ncbi:MAG TPA: T9SS type A sorting domain-containing protein [Ignavibacteria bacterium]|nr:T9SS type A sorting domain-containing protein [Ignavibacteria bacterium]
MKKILLIVFIFLLGVSSAQSQWTEFNTNFPYTLYDVSFFGNFNGFACGEQGSILKTGDAAANWEVVHTVPGKWFKSIDQYGFGSAFAVGSYGAAYLTIDNGTTWTDMSLANDIHLNCVKLVGGSIWAVGYNGAFYISPSPGVWNPPVTQIPYTMNSLDPSPDYFVDGTAIITCVDGRLYRTTNFGTNWTQRNLQNQGIFDYLNSVKFLTPTTAIIVGNNGTVLRSTNAGHSWTRINHFATAEHLRKVDAAFNGIDFTVVAVGDNGTILTSHDGGLTWALQTTMPFTTRHLYGVSTPIITNGFIVGEIGTSATAAAFMSNMASVGITNHNSEVPEKFNLSQNYPNPFNPSTKINFAIPQSQNVKLAVYDMTGKEIALLVNGNLNAGTYEYTFDGKNLNSGVYFYRLTAGNYTETKKMSLIK